MTAIVTETAKLPICHAIQVPASQILPDSLTHSADLNCVCKCENVRVTRPSWQPFVPCTDLTLRYIGDRLSGKDTNVPPQGDRLLRSVPTAGKLVIEPTPLAQQWPKLSNTLVLDNISITSITDWVRFLNFTGANGFPTAGRP